MPCRLLSWIPGLNLLYVSSTLLLVVITKNVSRPSHLSCGGSITHKWEQGSKRMKLHLCNLWASSNQQGSTWEVLLGPWVFVGKGPCGLLIELYSQIVFFQIEDFLPSDGIMMTWLWKKNYFLVPFSHRNVHVCIYVYTYPLYYSSPETRCNRIHTHTHTYL